VARGEPVAHRLLLPSVAPCALDQQMVQLVKEDEEDNLAAVGQHHCVDPLVPAPAGVFSAAPTYANSGFKYLVCKTTPAAVSAASYVSALIRP